MKFNSVMTTVLEGFTSMYKAHTEMTDHSGYVLKNPRYDAFLSGTGAGITICAADAERFADNTKDVTSFNHLNEKFVYISYEDARKIDEKTLSNTWAAIAKLMG